MTLRRSEAVIQAVLQGLTTAISGPHPAATLERNRDIVTEVGDGLIIIRDGDMGEPQIILSPRGYSYHHAIGVEVIAPSHEVLDSLIQTIDDWIEDHRGLGGLTDWIEASAPQSDGAEKSGTDHLPFALFDLVASYTTPSPLK